MIWIAGAIAYCVVYAGVVSLASGSPVARLWAGDIGLLLSPLLPIAVVFSRRRDWNGRALIYWSTMAVGCGLWMAGHVGWSAFELGRDQLLPWLEWPVVLKLTGAVMPMLGLIAWPHAQIRGGSLATAVLDIAGLTLVSAFLFWSFIVAPGLAPYASAVGVRSLAVIGLVLHVVILACFLGAAAAARRGPWRTAYRRLALGTGVGSLLLTTNAGSMAAGTYLTGSFGDIGWIVPFWCFAWAAWDAPRSPKADPSPFANWLESPTVSPLLFVPVLVPIVGYGPRFIAPLGPSIDRFCDVVTALTLTGALGLTMIRVAVEQRARHRSDYRVWLLGTACEQSNDLIVVVRSTAIEYANQAFQRAFGYTLEDLRMLPPQDLVARSSATAMLSMIGVLKRREVARARLTLRRRDGSTFEARCSVTPIASASGRSAYFVGVVHDVTEELRLRDQMVAHERLSAIGDVVSGVAHEISNPLQSVIGLAELILQGSLDPEARADVDRMRIAAVRAGGIIRSLHVFIRRTPFDRRPIDVNATLRKIIALRTRELARHNIQVDEQLAPDLPPVVGTGDDLQQAVWQLVVNAEEAMRRGGGRVLTLRTTAEPTGVVAVEVADDGPGVPASVAGRIFEPFFSTKPVGAGQGLGLSIAFGIAAAHGGSLQLVPSDHGARFRLTLPSSCA